MKGKTKRIPTKLSTKASAGEEIPHKERKSFPDILFKEQLFKEQLD
jgi:hypothetical protein